MCRARAFGQQPADVRVPAVGPVPLDHGLDGQDATVELLGSGQRNRAGKAGGDQRPLGFDGGPNSTEINRGPMGLDDHGPAVLQLDSPDGIDAAGAEADISDHAAQSVLDPAVQERVQFGRLHPTVNRSLGVGDVDRRPLAVGLHGASMPERVDAAGDPVESAHDRRSAVAPTSGADGSTVRTVGQNPTVDDRPLLVVFCGLPGVGKTTVSRLVADQLQATFLRIDTLERAIAATLMPFQDNPVGYVAAEWVAADQLRAGRPVVVDAVNNVEQARAGWRALAREWDARLHFVEVTCSDKAEHRRRVESRTADLSGLEVPTWEQVSRRRWEPFAEPRLTVDHLGDSTSHARTVVAAIRAAGPMRSNSSPPQT